jgi:hypothetical protein
MIIEIKATVKKTGFTRILHYDTGDGDEREKKVVLLEAYKMHKGKGRCYIKLRRIR